MSAGDEIMMPVPVPEAVAMAEIHALRQISDALQTTNRNLQGMSTDLKDVRERVIKIEAKDMDAKIAEYRAECRETCATLTADLKALGKRIDDLETIRDRQAGALSVGGWLSKYFPWLFGLAASVAAALSWKGGA